ncbi:protein of unknown function [Cupriavidus taiwanensis]|nr:protein of unknown function [Cupriavidus taiwanensis]
MSRDRRHGAPRKHLPDAYPLHLCGDRRGDAAGLRLHGRAHAVAAGRPAEDPPEAGQPAELRRGVAFGPAVHVTAAGLPHRIGC